ncbi:MAG: nucleoside monophosphate kinase [Spirochaetaceae bacterium]|nr:nucleoside monophosphate kinase [Spirochaetaceae bacterium]
MNVLYRALLLIGATGSGKTPFGQQLETQRLWSMKWHHFDFGQKLRDAVAEKETGLLSKEELSIVENSLKTNSLLGNKDFPIAEKLLKKFVTERCNDIFSDVVILNGLPRNVAQAKLLANIINVRTVIHFEAPPSVLLDRINSDAGGDRAGRTDDSLEEIYRKLEIFGQQTMPLINFYKELDKNIFQVEVDFDTLPLYIIQELETIKPAI